MSRMRTESWAQGALIVMLAATLVAAGCGRGKEESEAAPARETTAAAGTPAYPAALSAASLPKDVAAVLIQALDADDHDTLLGLVAVKAASQDVNAIYEKHGRKSNLTPDKVARLAANGWRLTYNFFEQGQTFVAREMVAGEEATVFADGKAPNGVPKTMKIELVREDGLWKVKPGLKSGP